MRRKQTDASSINKHVNDVKWFYSFTVQFGSQQIKFDSKYFNVKREKKMMEKK